MEKEDIAYCGLSCALCKSKFSDIREKLRILDEALENVNMQEIANSIPLMKYKYWGYKKVRDFFSEECPGCRDKGGNPFCGIRKCAVKRNYFTCAECGSLCKKFNSLFRVHVDNEIQNNIKQIKESGIESIVEANL